MARKVFISFLGTTNYAECIYEFEGRKSTPVRFVQEALIKHFCQDWTEKDHIYIFCTSKTKTGKEGAKEINWEDGGQSRITEEIERVGLGSRLARLKELGILQCPFEEVDIVSGFTKAEIWNIFDKVYECLEDDDKIYFDVTHAFRSIPLFSMVLFDYSKFLKNTNLVSVLYGAFERLGTLSTVKLMPVEQRNVSVIDLSDLVRLQEYNQIASGLRDFGKVKPLHEAIENNNYSSLTMMNNLQEGLKELDDYINTNSLHRIEEGKFIRKFRENYRPVRNKRKLEKPIQAILDYLYQETLGFSDRKDVVNIEEAVKWTIKHGMYVQAYALGEEYVIWRIAHFFRNLKPLKYGNTEFRKFVSDILGAPEKDFEIKNWKNHKPADYPDIACLIADSAVVREVRPIYDFIRTIRNKLAHGNGISLEEVKENIPRINECILLLNKHKDDVFKEVLPVLLPSGVLLNLTNHPYETWDEKQRKSAKHYGNRVVDYPFPPVNPEWDEQRIEEEADSIVADVIQRFPDARCIHLMGEHNLCFALVRRFQANGIVCIASTSNREVKNISPNVIEKVFHFVRFRRY